METSECVRVAVNIRPLITHELLNGCTDCITVVPGEPQVQIGSHSFTYDFVYGSSGKPSHVVYDDCVAPLVEALFHGYNATVLAYGQTGSGKTYTMGTNYNGAENSGGIIPNVMENIYTRVEALKESSEFLIRVSFIEIFKEEVFDLLDPNSPTLSKVEGPPLAKTVAHSRIPIQIRETVSGGITLAGVTEAEVRTKEEMASHLSRGSLSRATASTNMNSQSSRSHAIFTITIEQKKIAHGSTGAINDDTGDDILCAKLHLVDLAGSERAKRTGADGMRFKEGISINKGLLALGNVISALGDEKKRKEGGHVPYRDSKLTRLLQDSLGGNSKTVMIACVSPADTNAEETLNTLKYANRARNIQNKAVINRDPMAAQMQRMRSQIEQLQSELLFYRGDAGAPFEELQILKQKISLLESSNAELQRELQERRASSEHLSKRAIDAQVEKDKLIMKLESARNGKSWEEVDADSNQDIGLVKSYVSKIQELEGELMHFKNLNNSKRSLYIDCLESDDDVPRSKGDLFSCHDDCDAKAAISDGAEVEETELEHSSLQEKLDKELKELDKKLEQKEAEMKRFSSTDTSVLKHHYERKVLELEQEKKSLQKEIDELRHNLATMPSITDDSAQKLKENYLQKLTALESQVSELKKKQDAQAQILRQKQKSDEAAKRLQDEIQRIKSQKVQLQHKIKQESEQFRLWKASREKEVLQLKKEGRRNEYEMHKLLALNQRQKMVLHRKTEEASMATKRLKELLESRKASSRQTSNGGPGIQALMEAIEHELEVTIRVHEVRTAYDRQMEERARMAKEVARLKEEAELIRQTNLSNCVETMSPGARNSRIYALENMLATSSSTLVSMASQLSEAEERERVFSGRGRWNQVRSLADAKNVMNYLFTLASSSRCLLRDKEVDCREKDSEIKDLKEKVFRLSSVLRQVEMQKAQLIHQVKSQNVTMKKYSMDTNDSGNMGGHKYDLRKLDQRSSIIFMEDMDTSESDHSQHSDSDADWAEQHDKDLVILGKRATRKRNSKGRRRSGSQSSNSTDVETSIPDSGNAVIAATGTGNNNSDVCCSCSKSSSCKTMKCECRASGGHCGESCGCLSSKCANRAAFLIKSDNSPSGVADEASGELASQGAMLLQSALLEKPSDDGEKPTVGNDGGQKRKPLTDIGNTLAKKAPKPSQRKKWRKSVIQLVPVPPPSSQPENTVPVLPPSLQSENTEAPPKSQENRVATEKNSASEAELPLKLPRAMRSVASNSSNPFRERNSENPNESGPNKEGGVRAARSPVRPARTAEEKENRRV